MTLKDRYKESTRLLEQANKIIPLGSQTFSKSVTQYPKGVSPLFITRGEGGHVWDVDGNEYVDFINALAAVSLGYADPEVTGAVKAQLDDGVCYSLPHLLEMQVAELLVELIPCAEMVRFGKNGTDATSAAIRLARAYTGKDHVLVCGYHGWQDWYIGSTSRHLGVPDAVRELTYSFAYNDADGLAELFDRLQNKVAAVIMEPMNVAWPEEGYLQRVKQICHDNSALFILDETITGCRFAKGGAQELFGVIPDIACFGKGLANGFPLSAVVGRRDVMEMMEQIFFSGTFGGETASLAAAKVVLTKVQRDDVVERLFSQGQKLFAGVQERISQYGVEHILGISGHPSWSILAIKDAVPYTSWEIKTLFLQEVFRRGLLTIGSHNMSYSHSDEDIVHLLKVYDEVFPLLREAVAQQDLLARLQAKPLQPLFMVR